MEGKDKKPDYEAAMRELETIVGKMESGELNVDSMAAELSKAQKLIKLCRDKLTKTDEEIKKILAEGQENA